MSEDYNTKYLKYKEKYLALQKEYNELIAKKNMKGGNGNQISGVIMTAEKKLPDNTKITVILFKADWCGHCKQFKPTWEKISDMYKQKYNFVTYDADSQTDKFKEYKVDAFPTVLVKNGSNVIPYDGDRSIDDLNNFLQSLK
jgi:thioredoxin-like negative regulator of GroEL